MTPKFTNAKELFTIVRDIPYHIAETKTDSDYSCHTKSAILIDLLKGYGFSARLRVCAFQWNKLSLPAEIKQLIRKTEGVHSFVEIQLKGKWITLDPSFDIQLKSKLPVNNWDGESNTELQVIPEKIFTPEESIKKIAKFREEFETDLEQNKALYSALNRIYEHLREK